MTLDAKTASRASIRHPCSPFKLFSDSYYQRASCRDLFGANTRRTSSSNSITESMLSGDGDKPRKWRSGFSENH